MFMLFVNLPDKRLSLLPSVLSESYEVDAMKSLSAGVVVMWTSTLFRKLSCNSLHVIL